ncbi:MAG: hypothetical protein F4025_02745, partial [Synechococcus sp. SB0669_bin_7]|nr:hypothetical protein [Synechococcus sp. SB0669_bin_7]
MIGIRVSGDTIVESDETVIATLNLYTDENKQNPPGVTVGTSTATYTIKDDDRIRLSIAPKTANTSVTEGSDAVFTVTASAAPAADLTVSLTVADAPNADFVSSTNQGSGKSVTIQAGQTTADFTVPTTGGASETTDEPSGDVKVTVNSGTGYTVSSSSSATVKVTDDDPTTVTLFTVDTMATEGSRRDWAGIRLDAGRPLRAGESLAVPLGFSGGAVGTDFTLSLEGNTTVVALSGGTVTFKGPMSWDVAAYMRLYASQDDDDVDETVTVSIPSSSTGSGTILTA